MLSSWRSLRSHCRIPQRQRGMRGPRQADPGWSHGVHFRWVDDVVVLADRWRAATFNLPEGVTDDGHDIDTDGPRQRTASVFTTSYVRTDLQKTAERPVMFVLNSGPGSMRRNPQLRLMIGAGYYDLATTLGTAEFTLTHSGIPTDATEMHLYPSGHMPYLGKTARELLARDVRAFVTRASR